MNIEGLSEAKKSCSEFINFISDYDIICLQETFTNKNSKIDLKGYKSIHSYRRLQNRRAKQASGGLVIYIRERFQKGVKVVKNDTDCIVWLKFDKTYFQMQNDIYLAVIYIVPENSPVHAFYNIDIFQKLQTDITYFKEKGKFFLCGDFNSRTSNKADYVENDRILGFQDDSVDIPLQRFSMDRGSNRFGEFL